MDGVQHGVGESEKVTFRVDTCSKHLLAALLIVQNVEAWKSSERKERNRRRRGLRGGHDGKQMSRLGGQKKEALRSVVFRECFLRGSDESRMETH